MTETYEFTLIVAGADVQTDEALNALAEVGCDDATVGSSGGVQHLDFDREASSYLAAVLSAIEDVEAAVPGVRTVRVLPDEYVTLVEIAQRTGRTRESARLLSIGERGPGGFPPPAARGAERNKLWRWPEGRSLVRQRARRTCPPGATARAASGQCALGPARQHYRTWPGRTEPGAPGTGQPHPQDPTDRDGVPGFARRQGREVVACRLRLS